MRQPVEFWEAQSRAGKGEGTTGRCLACGEYHLNGEDCTDLSELCEGLEAER